MLVDYHEINNCFKLALQLFRFELFVSRGQARSLISVIVESVGAQSGLGPCPGWGPVRVGALSGLGPSPGWGPVRVGAHIWAQMGPYGSSWTGLGRLRKLSVRLLDQFPTFRVQN
jgi:hypothetical protein